MKPLTVRKGVFFLLAFFLITLLTGGGSALAAETIVLPTDVPVYADSLSAQRQTNPTALYPAGTYYVYKRADNGMINISRLATTAGGWFNPTESAPGEPIPTEKILRRTTATALNFRTGPSTACSVIGQIPYGSIVEVLAQVDPTWYRILYDGKTGYVSGKYLQPVGETTAPAPAPTPTPTPTPTGATHVTNATVNFRSGPSTSYPVLAKLSSGVQVEKVGDFNATWSKILYNGMSGAISSSYLTPITASGAPVLSPTATRVTTASVNFRSGPGTGYSSYGVLAKGTQVGWIATTGSWSKVTYGGRTGYIYSIYLTTPAPTQPLPRIGLAWSPTASSSLTYSAEAIVKAGGTVVQLPQVKDEAGVRAALALVDGIIFSGGGDLDPAYYGQALLSGQPAMDIERISPDRDRSDLLLMNAAISADMPTLGICRGMQVMNVAAGGSLIQDIPLQVETAVVHRDPLRKVMVDHPISIKAGTQLSALLGSTELSVNSWHHQGIIELGTGLTPTAWSSDGLIEAFEMPDRKYMIGVQFHPETLLKYGKMLYLEMFRELVRQAQ